MFAINVSKYQVLNIKNLKSGIGSTQPIYIDFTFSFSSFLALKVGTHRSISNARMDLTSQVAYYS